MTERIKQNPIINSPNLNPNMYNPAKGLAESINIASIPTYKDVAVLVNIFLYKDIIPLKIIIN